MDEDQKAEPHDIRDDEPQSLFSAEDEELFGGNVSHSSRSVQAPLPLNDAAAFTSSVFGDGMDRPFEFSAADLSSMSVSEIAQTERSSDSVRAAAAPAVFDMSQDTWRSLNTGGDVMAIRRPNAGLDGPHEPFVTGDKPLQAAVEPQPLAATAMQQRRPLESTHGNLAVPALPLYYRLETHTHTKLVLGTDRAAVGATVDKIGEALRAENVDLEFKPEKCKWKCCFFLNTVCVFFQVRLWENEASPRAGEHVLEFQRRHGDGGPFMGFWRRTLAALGVRTSSLASRGGAPALTRASTSASLPMPSLGAAPSSLAPPSLASTVMPIPAQLLPKGPNAGLPLSGTLSEDDMAGVVNPFQEMVKSGLPDAALAGARGLAQLSTCKDHRMVMKQCNVVETLVNFMALPHKPHECLYFASAQIFAVACLANLSEEPVVQSSLYRSCGLLLDQVDNGCWRDRAMRREAARTLRNLAQDDQGTDSIIRQVGKERLQQWCQDTYPQLSDQSIISDAGIVSERIRSRWAVCV